jgi:hypothetical protein
MVAVGQVLSAWLVVMSALALSHQQFDVYEMAMPDELSPIAVVSFAGKPGHLVLTIGGRNGWMQRLDTAHQEPVWPPGEHRLIADAPTTLPGTGRRMSRWGQIDVGEAR